MTLITDDKKEFPSQTRNRERWIIDTVRENQSVVAEILWNIDGDDENHEHALKAFKSLHKMDRDAILLSGGILTDEQIEALK